MLDNVGIHIIDLDNYSASVNMKLIKTIETEGKGDLIHFRRFALSKEHDYIYVADGAGGV